MGISSINSILIQYKTHLLAIDSLLWISCLLYQKGLKRFGQFDKYQLMPGVKLETLMGMALGDKRSFTDGTLKLLNDNADLLYRDYGIAIQSGVLMALPVFSQYFPPYPEDICELLIDIAGALCKVGKEPDESSMRKIVQHLARYYSRFLLYYESKSRKVDKLEIIGSIYRRYLWTESKNSMVAMEELKGGITDVVTVDKLYTIFERC